MATPMKYVFILMVLFSQSSAAQTLNDIEWITEEFPPLNYTDKNGQIQGFTVDILLEMWKKVGLNKTKKDITVMPWARGISMLERDINVCLFGMGITLERKNRYQFVGGIPGVMRGLIAKRKSGYTFNDIEDVNFKVDPGRIGAVRQDLTMELFLSRGGNKKLLYTVPRGVQLVRMLKKGRVDLIAYGDMPAFKLMKSEGMLPINYEVVYSMGEGEFGYGFNEIANPRIIGQLQSALDELISTGVVAKIRDHHTSQ